MNNGLYEHLEVFVAIAQARSLTAASIATGIAQATVSRQLAALERHLGCKLFRRSTRALSLTEAGQDFLQQALEITALMQAAESAVQDEVAHLRGKLRVACSNGFGRRLLIPSLRRWQERHPELSVELVLSDQLSQVIAEGVDVAFRLAPLSESGLVARRIGDSQRIIVASPSYLRAHGSVREPEDLQRHQCLLFAGLERPGGWTFDGPEGRSTVHVRGPITLSTMDAQYEAVLAGLGIAMMPSWFWARELLDGQVTRLLEHQILSKQPIHAVTATRPRPRSKAATFIEFVEQLLQTSGCGR